MLEANNQMIDLIMSINYLNLNLVRFEPFLEPSIFHVNI